ncbi:hypothetical protein FNV43_RR10909 [Rhamnella rubrinervis]|uniref:Uncharacterized protein n=1 Tax=Rhamnella rubrinervis TaxID=2594499 RepID=A0A8K0MH89_9ROSA|nr:hypothetical protein FNV43_RR10909 [Rhamnella rubrinervis]
MGQECNRFHHHALHIHHRNTFLPMLCSRPSIKDVRLPNFESRSSSFSDDPVSPRIGCMGQVKRNNKIVGYPTPHRLTLPSLTTKNTTTNHNNNNVKYSKLKRLFSGKNLTSGSSVNSNTTAATSTSAGCGNRRRVVMNGANGSSRNEYNSENCVAVIDVVDLDPPLPVIKKVQKAAQEKEMDSLWKRRSGGVALKGLQLQQIHHPQHHLQPVTV